MFDFKTMRNTELMRDYRRILSSAIKSDGYTGQKEVIAAMLTTCRPRYDASFDHTLRMMHRMVRDGKPCPAKGLRKQMWEEIKAHVEEHLSHRECSLADAVATVLAEKRASRYFLSFKQASKIICHERKNNSRGIARN